MELVKGDQLFFFSIFSVSFYVIILTFYRVTKSEF